MAGGAEVQLVLQGGCVWPSHRSILVELLSQSRVHKEICSICNYQSVILTRLASYH